MPSKYCTKDMVSPPALLYDERDLSGLRAKCVCVCEHASSTLPNRPPPPPKQASKWDLYQIRVSNLPRSFNAFFYIQPNVCLHSFQHIAMAYTSGNLLTVSCCPNLSQYPKTSITGKEQSAHVTLFINKWTLKIVSESSKLYKHCSDILSKQLPVKPWNTTLSEAMFSVDSDVQSYIRILSAQTFAGKTPALWFFLYAKSVHLFNEYLSEAKENINRRNNLFETSWLLTPD